MASVKEWDTTWQDRFKKIYGTNISMLSLYPSDALSWVRIMDVPYGQTQIERVIRNPDQRVHIAKGEEFDQPKYAASEVLTLDLINVMDELRVKEQYYAGDTANALGHVADLNANYKRAIMKAAWLGGDVDPYFYGIVEDTASASTTIETPGHTDTASALTSAGQWDVYENMQKDIATMIANQEAQGFFGPFALLAPNLMRPFLQRYVVEYTATPYPTVMNMPVFYNPYIDTGATTAAAAMYLVSMPDFELHMTPIKARAYWDDNTESYVWRWKCGMIPAAIPRWNGTDYVKGICGFDIDLIT